MEKVSTATVIRLADFRKDIFDRIAAPAGDYCAPELSPRPPEAKPIPEAGPRDAGGDAVAMRGIVRSMLVMATEGAYDLRAGYPDSPYLDRFEIRFAELGERLSAVDAGAGADFRLLASRAEASLAALHDTVRREIAGRIDRDIEIPAFDGALEKVREIAIAAGVAFGALDMALKKG